MRKQRREPFVLVLFGATGDLAKRKVYSALYHLLKSKKISTNFIVVGVSRKQLSDDEYSSFVSKAVGSDCSRSFLKKFFYKSLDISKKESFYDLKNYLSGLRTQYSDNLVYYLSLHPSMFENVFGNLLDSELLVKNGKSRVAFEKPFGVNLESCTRINNLIGSAFTEDKVFRIDHYLNYKTVRNILALRFSNIFFERVWNKDFVDHVQIIANEQVGLEGRNNYLNDIGVLKDMFQNHLLQLASLIGMDEPASLNRKDISSAKTSFLRRFVLDDSATVRAQFDGFNDDLGYKSDAETFIALKLFVNNERWKGVPFFFKSGKNLDEKVTRIYIRLKNLDSKIFDKGMIPNSILINISGDEGVSIRFNVYHHLKDDILDHVFMSFLEDKNIRTKYLHPYERLLYRVIRGDNTSFVSGEESEYCWRIVNLVESKLKDSPMLSYKRGSKGPEEIYEMIKGNHRKWFV